MLYRNAADFSILFFWILCLILGFAGQIHAQTLENLFIHSGEDHRRVNLAATQFTQLLHSLLCHGICHRADRKRNEGLVRMESGIAIYLQFYLKDLQSFPFYHFP